MRPITQSQINQSGIPPQFIEPNSFSRYPWLIALQSTRLGGVSEGAYASLNLGINTQDSVESVRENTRRLCTAAGINPESIVSSEQVHGTEILAAEKPGRYHGYDAFMTDKRDLFLCIFTADCYPVLLFDQRHRAVGAVHAGWKGSAGRIVMKTIAAMQQCFNTLPAECIASIGTGISADAYEVDLEVARNFLPDECQRRPSEQQEEKYMLDLSMVNYRQLLASGIPASNIERSQFCSFADSDLFFSYRRDHGQTGRMASIIGIRSMEMTA